MNVTINLAVSVVFRGECKSAPAVSIDSLLERRGFEPPVSSD
jgi:hypothetical protein